MCGSVQAARQVHKCVMMQSRQSAVLHGNSSCIASAWCLFCGPPPSPPPPLRAARPPARPPSRQYDIAWSSSNGDSGFPGCSQTLLRFQAAKAGRRPRHHDGRMSYPYYCEQATNHTSCLLAGKHDDLLTYVCAYICSSGVTSNRVDCSGVEPMRCAKQINVNAFGVR